MDVSNILTIMLPGSISEIIENNTVEYFLSLGHAAKNEILDTPKVKYILNDSSNSRIFKASLSNEEADLWIDKVMTMLIERNLSALWYITPLSRPELLESLLEERGFRYQKDWISMAITADDIRSFELPQGLIIKEALGDEELKTWSAVLVKSFEIREDISDAYGRYFTDIGIGDRLKRRYYIGYLGSEPVATASLFNGSEAAGIYYVGTLRQYRNNGIGMAMTGRLLQEAGRLGHSVVTLNASQSGYPLYNKMGFKEYYKTKIYQWP
jgi:GNAT superfamily N-acetyltransferase